MIVDQYGRSVQWQAASGAQRYGFDRPWQPVEIADIGRLVPGYDRETLLSASRRLFLNMGVARGAIEQKAMYAVGRSWLPRFDGTDDEFGVVATDWLSNQWFGICDLRGGMHDFRTALYLLSVAIDRDGEAFVLLTETEDDYPRLQHIPCHRVRTPGKVGDVRVDDGEVLKVGPYRGLRIVDGIVYGRTGAPVAVSFVDTNGEFSDWLSMRDLIHLYDPSWQEQGRGLPALTHAINDLRDSLQSHDWERQAQMMLSTLGLIEYNELGGPDPSDPSTVLAGGTPNTTGLTVENYSGGTIRYFKSNSGSKLEQIAHTRPNDLWDTFQDRIIRSALAGINWPYSLVWKATGQGTAERSELGKAERAIQDRQDILLYAAKRMVGYAVAKAQKLNLLPESADWWRWSFTMPPKLTIDDGRVAKELESAWKAGFRNHADIVGMLGKDLRQHYRERAAEIRLRKELAREFSGGGIEIEDREMAMLTPNEQQQPQQPQRPDDEDEPDDQT